MNRNKVLQLVQNRSQQALDLVFPPQCASCKRVGSILCGTCFARLQPSAPLPYRQDWHALQGLVAVNTFEGEMRTCIHALKYDGVTRLAEPLGTLLAHTYRGYGLHADVLVPVPLHSQRHKQRGYNHARLLAHECAARINVPLIEHVLVRSRATHAQVGLSALDRKHNVVGAFSIAPELATAYIRGRRIIIVDDVCTTGATLDACATTLFGAGALSVWGLVLASSVV